MFSKKSTPPVSITCWLLIVVTIVGLAGCGSARASEAIVTGTSEPAEEPLVLYGRSGEIPQAVLDAFSSKYGVEVTYLSYDSQEEALKNMRKGREYDVVIVDNRQIPVLVAEGLLTEIDYEQVPHLERISAASGVKNLPYDPDYRYSIPFNWGTTALVVRHDLVQEPVTCWADLWNPAYAGKIAIRDTHRDIIGLTLKSLGYSVNSEDPAELAAARERLLQLRPAVMFVDSPAEEVTPLLESGEVVILVGWSEDVLSARVDNLDVSYVLPEEGPLMWGDNLVIPANSRHPDTAELFLNFMLRPEINAQITNPGFYSAGDLAQAEVTLPLSQAGEAHYAEIWRHFLAVP